MPFALALVALCAALLATAPASEHRRAQTRTTADGRTVTVTVDRQGDRELIRRCSDGLCEGRWREGTRRWSFGINEVLLPDDGAAGDVAAATAFARSEQVAEPLLRPAGPALTFRSAPPLALAPAPVPIVACRLGGLDARCLLDSGTSPSLVTLPLAERLGAEPAGAIEIEGVRTRTTGVATAGPLELGGARFERVRLAVVPAVRGLDFDVTVGADLLGRVELVLDRRAGLARVEPPGSVVPARTVPLRFERGLPWVEVELAGVPAHALLDTGDDALLSEGYAHYRQGTAWPALGRGSAVGFGGRDDTFEIALPSAAVGTLQLGPVHALVRRTQQTIHAGIGLWTRCTFVLDEENARLGC